jgi:uncharacterized coiled-coil DUF342 family protein
MSLKDINNAFQQKINSINNMITFLESEAGREPPKGATLAFFAATAVNIKDLYEMLQTSINLMASFRKQIDLISERAENLSESVKDVKQQYDHTLGSLKDRLNKINKGDEEKKKQNRGIPFYG